MSNALRKTKKQRRRTVNPNLRSSPPVLIVRPRSRDEIVNYHTSLFVMAAVMRGIAEELALASMTPELVRNKGIHELLNNERFKNKSHIFFLDDDSTPINYYAIEQLMRSDKSVICGVTPLLVDRIEPKLKLKDGVLKYDYDNGLEPNTHHCSWNVYTNNKGIKGTIGIKELPKNIFPVERMGGTCILIKREVLEKLKPPYQKFTYNEEYISVTKSEDLYFADKIREAGFKIWADPDCKCHHWHRLDIFEIFNMLIQANELGLEGKKL